MESREPTQKPLSLCWYCVKTARKAMFPLYEVYHESMLRDVKAHVMSTNANVCVH